MPINFNGSADPKNVKFTDENANTTQIEKVVCDGVVVWESVNTIQYTIRSRSGQLFNQPANGWFDNSFGSINPNPVGRFFAFAQVAQNIVILFFENPPNLPTAVRYNQGSFPLSFDCNSPGITGSCIATINRNYNPTANLMWNNLANNADQIVFEFII